MLVVATPCPLLIAIPGGDHRLGLAGGPARHHHQGPGRAGKDRHLPHGHLRQDRHADLRRSRSLTEVLPAAGFAEDEVLARRRQPRTLLAAPAGGRHHCTAAEAADVRSARGRRGQRAARRRAARTSIGGRAVQVTSRKKLAARRPAAAGAAPAAVARRAGMRRPDRRPLRRDVPVPRRAAAEGRSFVRHLKPQHGFDRVLLVSGDRETEVRYLAEQGRHHARSTPARAPNRSWRSSARRRRAPTRSSWATASTTPRR